MSARVVAGALGYFLRHAGNPPGRWRLVAAAMKQSGALKGHLRPTVVGTAHGFRMIVDGSSQAGRVLYLTGRYEPEITAVFERLVKPGDVVIDGGAHIGFFALLASALVGPSGRVFAFEPARATRMVLEQNVALNGRENVMIVPAALGAAAGRAILSHGSAHESGQATIRGIAGAARTEPVDVVALDDRIGEDAGRVALVKLDLEGAELQALIGMARLILVRRPAIVVEVTDSFLRQTGGSAAALFRHLTGFGYAAHIIRWNGVETAASEAQFREGGKQFNALFTHAGG
jgi:FkbM family methyltransferase